MQIVMQARMPQKPTSNKQGQMTNRRTFIFCLGASLIIWAIYGQVLDHSFINFDDTLYITHNQNVQSGLNATNLFWALTTSHASNWHPVTWISHMLDCQLFGLQAGLHHLVNVLFHLGSTILLFVFFNTSTKKFWASAFISLLFAVHPLHVESVAWAAERKDVLSTFWMMLVLVTYTSYTRKPGGKKYLGVLLFFSLGLLSKPMLVTLPFLLLLLDYWPLGRLEIAPISRRYCCFCTPPEQLPKIINKRNIQHLIVEKIPLFLLAGLSSIITLIVQQQSGAVKSLQMMPLLLRLENATVTYIIYLLKMIWPVNLAIIYPFPNSIPFIYVLGALIILSTITVLVFSRRKTEPFLLVGWLWYLGTLVPVIGLIQVGVQAMADRYTYTPLVGIFVMIAFYADHRYTKTKPLLLTALVVLVCSAIVSWNQTAYWQNSRTIFRHALAVSDNNYTAHNYLALALTEQGEIVEAEKQYHEALNIAPDYLEALVNMGVLLAKQGRRDEAKNYLAKALTLENHNPKILNNLGNIAKSGGELEKSIRYYRRALQENPDYEEALFNLANSLEKQHKYPESITLYNRAINLNPKFVAAYNGLGVVWAKSGDMDQAARYFKMAITVKPGYKHAMSNLRKVQSDVP